MNILIICGHGNGDVGATSNINGITRKEETVVRTKSIYLEPMSLDEAITRMEAIDHPFFIYLDEEDDKISVCYTREDGGYGVIQAENSLK